MEKQTLKNANELNQQLDKLDRFICGCKQSWKNIFIPVQKRSKSLKIKYHGYGYVNSDKSSLRNSMLPFLLTPWQHNKSGAWF